MKGEFAAEISQVRTEKKVVYCLDDTKPDARRKVCDQPYYLLETGKCLHLLRSLAFKRIVALPVASAIIDKDGEDT